MSEIDREVVVEQKTPGWLAGVAIAGVLLSLGALGWALGLQNHLNADEASLASANQQNTALSQKLDEPTSVCGRRPRRWARVLA